MVAETSAASPPPRGAWIVDVDCEIGRGKIECLGRLSEQSESEGLRLCFGFSQLHFDKEFYFLDEDDCSDVDDETEGIAPAVAVGESLQVEDLEEPVVEAQAAAQPDAVDEVPAVDDPVVVAEVPAVAAGESLQVEDLVEPAVDAQAATQPDAVDDPVDGPVAVADLAGTPAVVVEDVPASIAPAAPVASTPARVEATSEPAPAAEPVSPAVPAVESHAPAVAAPAAATAAAPAVAAPPRTPAEQAASAASTAQAPAEPARQAASTATVAPVALFPPSVATAPAAANASQPASVAPATASAPLVAPAPPQAAHPTVLAKVITAPSVSQGVAASPREAPVGSAAPSVAPETSQASTVASPVLGAANVPAPATSVPSPAPQQAAHPTMPANVSTAPRVSSAAAASPGEAPVASAAPETSQASTVASPALGAANAPAAATLAAATSAASPAPQPCLTQAAPPKSSAPSTAPRTVAVVGLSPTVQPQQDAKMLPACTLAISTLPGVEQANSPSERGVSKELSRGSTTPSHCQNRAELRFLSRPAPKARLLEQPPKPLAPKKPKAPTVKRSKSTGSILRTAVTEMPETQLGGVANADDVDNLSYGVDQYRSLWPELHSVWAFPEGEAEADAQAERKPSKKNNCKAPSASPSKSHTVALSGMQDVAALAKDLRSASQRGMALAPVKARPLPPRQATHPLQRRPVVAFTAASSDHVAQASLMALSAAEADTKRRNLLFGKLSSSTNLRSSTAFPAMLQKSCSAPLQPLPAAATSSRATDRRDLGETCPASGLGASVADANAWRICGGQGALRRTLSSTSTADCKSAQKRPLGGMTLPPLASAVF